MKAEELTLGSWVRLRYKKYGTGEEVVKDFQVSELRRMYKECPDVDAWSVEDGNMGDVERLEGIPLTPEILEKNGFVKDEETNLCYRYHLLIPTGYEENSYTIQVTFYKEPIMGVNILFRCWGWVPPENGGINDIHLCSMTYVHELQNALRLCKIYKEIVL